MVGLRLTPLPTELFDVAYQDITERVEKRARGRVRRGLGAVRSDLLDNTDLRDVLDSLYSGGLTPANLYREMAQRLSGVDLVTSPISGDLENAGKSVIRIASRDIAKNVDEYLSNRPDFDASRRDVRFDDEDQYLAEEILRGSQIFWHIYERDTIRAIKDEIEDSYLSGDQPDVMARRVEQMVGLSPRQALALRRMRKTIASGPLPVDARERQVEEYAQKLLDDRAKMVARTELNRVANASVISYWSQMMARGSLDRNSVVVRWNTQYDERTCPTCGPLDGVSVAIHASFTPTVAFPPAHPNCRCSLSVASISYAMSEPEVELVKIEKSLKSVARGGARIAAAMTPEERSARTRRGWEKRKRAKKKVAEPKRRGQLRSKVGISVRTQTEAAREKSGVDFLPSDGIDKWPTDQQMKMLEYLKKYSPDFDSYKGKRITRPQQAVDLMKDNLRSLVEELGGVDSDFARKARQWYASGSALCTDMGSSVAKKHPDAVGAAVVAILSPKNDWNNNVGQAAVLTDLWANNEPMTDSDHFQRVFELITSEVASVIEKKSKQLADGRAELEVWKETGYSSSGKTKKTPKAIADREAELEEVEDLIQANTKFLAKIEKSGVKGFTRKYKGTGFRDLPDDMQGWFFRGLIDSQEFVRPDVSPTESADYEIKEGDLALTSPMPVPAEKALRVLRSSARLDSGDMTVEDFQKVLEVEMGNGTKVRSFYMNLYDPFDDEQKAVTIDTHMGSANLLLPLGADQTPIDESIFSQWAGGGTGRAYMLHAEAVRQLADELGVLPRELQSIVWEHQLGRYGGGGGAAKEAYKKRFGKLAIQVVDRIGYEVYRDQFDSRAVPLWRERSALQGSKDPDDKKRLKEVESLLDDVERDIKALLKGRRKKEGEGSYLKEKKRKSSDESDEQMAG